jgi:TRAP-type C4-dicarboxylate transport system substrate-binding protein
MTAVEPVNPSGPTGVPVVLQIGTNDFPGRPAADQIQDLADRVAELSDDTIRLEPTWRVGWDEPDWDQYVAREVMSGALDLAIVPSRAWPELGVTRLQVLDAPFLIDSDPLLDEVVTNDLAQEVLGDLEGVGVVGLALLPEGLRHPFGFDEALLGPEHYQGETIRAPQAQATEALFGALGATTSQADTDPSVQAGVEANFQLDFVSGMAATGNVTFYPKVGALVMNADAYDDLTGGQQELLQQAAAETLQWSIDTRQSDVEAAAAFCEQGGIVTLASEAELAALRDATQTVFDDLEDDPSVAADIAAVRAMAADLGAPPPCRSPAGNRQPATNSVTTSRSRTTLGSSTASTGGSSRRRSCGRPVSRSRRSNPTWASGRTHSRTVRGGTRTARWVRTSWMAT